MRCDEPSRPRDEVLRYAYRRGRSLRHRRQASVAGVIAFVLLAGMGTIVAVAGRGGRGGAASHVIATAGTTTTTSPAPVVAAVPSTPPSPETIMPGDISFVSVTHGFALASVCRAACVTVLETTVDGGRTWRRLPPPPSGSQSVVRFADERNGYLFANPLDRQGPVPPLLASHDGGQTWQETTITQPVFDLVTGTNDDWAVVGDCSALHCSFDLAVSVDRGRSWQVRSFGRSVVGNGASLTRAGDRAWLLTEPDDEGNARPVLFSGDGGATWSDRRPPCQSSRASLAVTGQQDLWAVCSNTAGAGEEPKSVVRSADGGQHWRTVADSGGPPDEVPVGMLTISGYVAGLVAVSDQVAWMGLSRGALLVTTDGGTTWKPAAGAPPPESFVEALQGIGTAHGWASIAVTTGSPSNGIYRTSDGGRTWVQGRLA